MSVSGCAGLRAREHCESAACTQTPQKSPTKSVGKQQSYVPQLVVDGTVKAVTFPAPPPSLQSPFAEPTAGVNLELMSSLLMQSPRRTHRQQPAQQAQHQRSLSAEAPRVKLASELERSRTAGYLDRAFMASLSTVPRYCPSLCCGSTCMHTLLLQLMFTSHLPFCSCWGPCCLQPLMPRCACSLAPQMPLSKSSISLGSRAYGGQALASSQDLGSSPSAQARQAEAELVDLDSLLGDTVAGVLLGRSGRTGHGLLDGLL